MKQLGLPIALSLALHAILAGLLFWGAFSLSRAETGGSGTGGVVSVWIAGPAGEMIGAGGVPHPRFDRLTANGKKTSPSASDMKTSPSVRPKPPSPVRPEPVEGQSASQAESGTPGSGTGGGNGVGSGQGSGVGAGSGGNPVLAKIWKRINSSKYYPETAKHQGMEGSPRVTFSIAEDGSVSNVAIATSCGQAILDDAAKETVRRASPLPFYPQPITLTVKYSLAN